MTVAPEDLEPLLRASDARDFLRKVLLQRSSARRKISASAFARRAGLSRSYWSELMAEKKGFSLDAVLKIKSALKLPRNYGTYFEYLAYRDFPRLRPPSLKTEHVATRLAQLKLQLSAMEAPTRTRWSERVGTADMLLVYAALGSVEEGARVREICSRTGLPESAVKNTLLQLLDIPAVKLEGLNYYPLESQVDIWGLGEDSAFAALSSEILRFLTQNHRSLIAQKNSLLFHTACAVRSADLPQLREELKTAFSEILDRYQTDHGDVVQELNVAFYNRKS